MYSARPSKKRFFFSICLFLLCLFISPGVYCQSNFHPGFITKTNGDIIHGYIDYKQWEVNPKVIKFKSGDKAEIERLTVAELLSFQMSTGEQYIKAEVKKDMRPVDVDNLKNEQYLLDTVVTDTVFLRHLQRCDFFTLYLLNDEKKHFYIKEPTGDFIELVYKVGITSNATGDFLVPKNIFRNQLQLYINNRPDFNKLNRKLEVLHYNENELAGFVALLVSGSSEEKEKKEKGKLLIIASAGGSFSKLKVSGSTLLKDHQFANSWSPIVSVGLDLFSRNLGEIVIRPEISYSYLEYKSSYQRAGNVNGSTTDERYHLRISNITPSVSAFYSFLRNQRYRVYAGGQVGYTISFYPENTFTKENEVGSGYTSYKEYLDFEKSWTNISLKIGAVLRKRFEISGSALIAGSFSRFSNINIDPSIYNLQFVYHLN